MTHRLTLLAAAFALAAAPAMTSLARQDQTKAGDPLTQQRQQPGQQQPGQQQPGQPVGEQPMNDQLFVMAAAASGMGEIGISQLAKQKTQDQQVQQYADMMIQDHTQANQQLAQLAGAKGIEVPQRPGLKDTATAMALSGCSPEQFAREFFKQQEAAHVIAIGLFKAEAERGQDPEIREFARTTLPKLEQHLQMARQHAGGGQGQGQPQPGEASQSGRGATDQDLIDALEQPSGNTP
jgi:putative membrane protein